MGIVAGARLTPEITLVEPLGEGAMGRVWLAEHAGLGQRIAVKFVAPELATDGRTLARFRREAAAAAQLRSPHTVRSLEHGTSPDGVPFIAMELLEGETLGARLERVGRLDLETTCRVVRHVGAALAEAHELGIVHRDVKADNVFLIETPDGLLAKVLDFGMAKQVLERSGSIVTATGVVVGTPEYMSPEQVLGSKQLDHRTDLWAVGVLAYRALVGAMPFGGPTPHAMVFAICKAEYKRASSFGLPTALDPWFERALAPQADRRFSSAAELVDALDGALDANAKRERAKAMEDAPTLLVSAAALAARSMGGAVPIATPPGDPPLAAAAPPARPSAEPPPSGGDATVALEQLSREGGAATVAFEQPSATAGDATVALEQPQPPPPRARGMRRLALPAFVVAGVGVAATVASGWLRQPASSTAMSDDGEDEPVGSAGASASAERAGEARSGPDRRELATGAQPTIDLDSEWADGTGRLSVDCTPRCSDVRIGGRSLGPSPLEAVEVPAGDHSLALFCPDRPTTYVRVRIDDGAEVRQTFTLAAGPAPTAEVSSAAETAGAATPPAEAEPPTVAPAASSGRFEPNEL